MSNCRLISNEDILKIRGLDDLKLLIQKILIFFNIFIIYNKVMINCIQMQWNQ
jgi:hypothetical protein